ncbi:hypothetical protein HRG84_19710 [Flavisolibacter sp. BT320]|nr:hypothetical protein [Flavisolibacter longurius]
MTKFLGAIVILISLLVFKGKTDLSKVEKEGEIVPMRILALPNDCSIKNSSMQLQLQKKRFFKKAYTNICKEYKVGDTILMKYHYGVDSVLYPAESVTGELAAMGVLMSVGIVCVVLGFRRKAT